MKGCDFQMLELKLTGGRNVRFCPNCYNNDKDEEEKKRVQQQIHGQSAETFKSTKPISSSPQKIFSLPAESIFSKEKMTTVDDIRNNKVIDETLHNQHVIQPTKFGDAFKFRGLEKFPTSASLNEISDNEPKMEKVFSKENMTPIDDIISNKNKITDENVYNQPFVRQFHRFGDGFKRLEKFPTMKSLNEISDEPKMEKLLPTENMTGSNGVRIDKISGERVRYEPVRRRYQIRYGPTPPPKSSHFGSMSSAKSLLF